MKLSIILLYMPYDRVNSTSQELCKLFMLCYIFVLFGTCQLYPYFSRLLHWYWGNHITAPVLVKETRRIWVNKSYESIKDRWFIHNKEQENLCTFYKIYCAMVCWYSIKTESYLVSADIHSSWTCPHTYMQKAVLISYSYHLNLNCLHWLSNLSCLRQYCATQEMMNCYDTKKCYNRLI